MNTKTMCALVALGAVGVALNISAIAPTNAMLARASVRTFDDFDAVPPIHILAGSGATSQPKGLTPAQVKTAYLLPSTGGSGTIAIISAYEHPAIESDLATFDTQFKLTACTVANKCLDVYDMKTATSSPGKGPTNAGWDLESALDTQWAHAIAPKAKILVVESASTKGADLMKAIDYARAQPGVVSVSMSWGGDEFSDETKLDSHFSASGTAPGPASNIAFFASSGDDGNGASWPAASPRTSSASAAHRSS